LAAAKESAVQAEKRVETEKEIFKEFHERAEKGVGEPVKRTGEVEIHIARLGRPSWVKNLTI
jgi:hypothetical protein